MCLRYGLIALLGLCGMRECFFRTVNQILPLLYDPKPEVREEAKRTLQRLGYQVRE